jgi:hypothetical protein
VKLSASILLLLIAAGSSFGQQLDKAFYGRWNLDLTKSKFGSDMRPKMSSVLISPEGWVATSYFEAGFLDAYAVASKSGVGCTLIGFPPEFSCEFKLADSRHGTFTVKQGGKTVQQTEVELRDENTFTIKQTATTPKGPIVDEGFYQKAKPPAATKK